MPEPPEAIEAALDRAVVDKDPFPHLVIDALVDPGTAGHLLDWLERDAEWEQVAESFYQSSLCTNLRSALRSPAGPLFGPDALLAMLDGVGRRLGVEFDRRRIMVWAHRYLPGQSVGIHTDAPANGTETHRLVLHLTRSFSPGHGGYLEFFHDRAAPDPVRSFPPRHGSAVSFALSTHSFHRVTPIAGGTRYTLVYSFWSAGSATVPDPDHADLDALGLDPAAVDLLDELGAADLPHASTHAGGWAPLVARRSLRSHLAGTARVLRRWGCDDDVVTAGLLHGVYGALGFTRGLLDLDSAPRVRAAVGSRAERLVFLFSELDRSSVTDDGGCRQGRLLTDGRRVTISARDSRDLQLLIWANLVEQLPHLDLSPPAARTMAATVLRTAEVIPRRAAFEVGALARAACRR